MVGSVRQAGLDPQPLPEIYFPYTQMGAENRLGKGVLVVRTAQAPESATAAVRRAVTSVDPGLPCPRSTTMEEVIAESLAARRLNLWLLGIFAGIALAARLPGSTA